MVKTCYKYLLVILALGACDSNVVESEDASRISSDDIMQTQSLTGQLDIDVYRLFPDNDVQEATYGWIAVVNDYGINGVTDCTYNWSLKLPNNNTQIIFQQNMHVASQELMQTGSYTVNVTANCNSDGVNFTGTGSHNFNVTMSSNPTWSAPGGYIGGVPIAVSSGNGTDPGDNNGICNYWHGYDADEGKWYRYRNEFCGAGYVERKEIFGSGPSSWGPG